MNTTTAAHDPAAPCPTGINADPWMRSRVGTSATGVAEEAFFVLRGRVKLVAELNGETWEMEASDRDLISWPVGVCRGVVNIGDEEALMCVIVGAPKPTNPTYPPGHPLSKVKR